VTDAASLPSPSEAPAGASLMLRAHLLGDRIDLRGLEHEQPLALAPVIIRVGEAGHAVFLRYGIVVTCNVSEPEERSLLASVRHLVTEPLETPEVDQVQAVVRADADDQIDPAGRIILKEFTASRLQIVADTLAKHVILSHHEGRVASVFDRLEPLAGTLGRTGRTSPDAEPLVRQIGGVLLVQQKMVGRVEVAERPEVLWDYPDLERFYARLEAEYELRERGRALDRKLELLFRTAETLLRLVEARRMLRLEWYVIILIAIEILLSLYGIFGPVSL
jgi:uncharacterized Rmd1/YagE family protein